MLHPLQAPEWHPDGAAPQALPGTLPVCLLVHLAVQALGRSGIAGRPVLA